MNKLELVRQVVAASPLGRNWLRGLKTDQDALVLINDCLEGDDESMTFPEALEAFKRHFASYAEYCRELDESRDLGSPYEY